MLMQRMFLFAILVSVPWVVITGWNIGRYVGNQAGLLAFNLTFGANTTEPEPTVWAIHPDAVWKITAVWSSILITVWVAGKVLIIIRDALRPSEAGLNRLENQNVNPSRNSTLAVKPKR